MIRLTTAAFARRRRAPPRYVWPIRYGADGGIKIHTDGPQNEVSITYQLALRHAPRDPFAPAVMKRSKKKKGKGKKRKKRKARRLRWPLHFLDTNMTVRAGDPAPSQLNISVEQYRAAPPVTMADNEGVLYRGRVMAHWRPPIAEMYPAARYPGVGRAEVLQLVFAYRPVHEDACLGGG